MSLPLYADEILPADADRATLIGRVWRADRDGPSVVVVQGGRVLDITCADHPTVRDLLERPDRVSQAATCVGEDIGAVADILTATGEDPAARTGVRLLAPIDLQVIKAAGVTFVVSLLERVIEEQARGEPEKAAEIRAEIDTAIGDDLSALVPGSEEAMALKALLIEKGVWSQYLEVGIGPDVEIFTKSPCLAAVGVGAEIGVHPMSSWNNPEPEIVVVANAAGEIIGATLGNDVNLRDVEGRSALLLGKAKDNNASCAIGPFIRLFDETYSLDDVRSAELAVRVEGEDGFVLDGASSMKMISRDPADMVAAMMGAHHQYPDGAVLFLGTMFAPVKDRDTPGEGFTHKTGDIVSISSERLGRLTNRVNRTDACPPWTYGLADLMRNLAGRDLL